MKSSLINLPADSTYRATPHPPHPSLPNPFSSLQETVPPPGVTRNCLGHLPLAAAPREPSLTLAPMKIATTEALRALTMTPQTFVWLPAEWGPSEPRERYTGAIKKSALALLKDFQDKWSLQYPLTVVVHTPVPSARIWLMGINASPRAQSSGHTERSHRSSFQKPVPTSPVISSYPTLTVQENRKCRIKTAMYWKAQINK